MPKIKVGDIQYFILTAGAGPAIVLIHGLGGGSGEWWKQIHDFSRRYRVVAPDLRGHGQSDKPDEAAYTPSTFANDLSLLLDELKIRRAWFCGISMGGFVTLRMALDFPEKVAGMILTSTASYVDEYTLKVGSRWGEAFLSKGFDAYMKLLIEDVFDPSYIRSYEADIKKFVEDQKHRDPETVRRAGLGAATFDVRADLPDISQPTLVVHGENDRVVLPQHAKLLHEQIGHSELLIIPECGHFVILEKPEAFNKDVLDFIARHQT